MPIILPSRYQNPSMRLADMTQDMLDLSSVVQQINATPGTAATINKNVALSGPGSVNTNSYPRWHAAQARVKAQQGNAVLARVGDSTETGYKSLGNGTGVTNNRIVCPAIFCAASLNQIGFPALPSSFTGDQNAPLNGGTIATYDTRVTLGAGWAGNIAVPTAGGGTIDNSTTTNSITFLPNEQVDTFVVYYATGPTISGQFTVSRTGDATSPILNSNSVSTGIGQYVFSGALGTTNPISIQRNGTGTSVFILGIIAYNSALKSLNVLNVGWNGGILSNWIVNVNAFDPLPTLLNYGADLYLIRPMMNEWASSIPVATSQANLDTLVAACLTVGDVVLATPYPTQRTSFTLAVQKPYIDAIYAVANKYSLAVNDTWHKVHSWEQANGFGFMADNMHPLRSLYQAAAESDANFILSL